MRIGEKIAACRKEAGLSQEALASLLDISRQAVSRWETGEAMPDTERIIQLSRIFQVSTDYLLLEELEEKTRVSAEPSPSRAAERRHFRVGTGIALLAAGVILALTMLVLAGLQTLVMTEWYTGWGRFGTALLRSWRAVPLALGTLMAIVGIDMLWREYNGIE